jgi:Protein of unknown function (DUF3710)
MAFGRRTGKDDKDDRGHTSVEPAEERVESEEPDKTPVEAQVSEEEAGRQGAEDLEELDGPFDIDDFDDPAVAELARLDLGSVLIPMPEGVQLQVELTETGVPSAVWVVTPNGRFTIAAYAAPKTAGLWREVAGELADSLRNDSAKVVIRDGPWGREVIGTASGVVHFIGVDGYRWMIRCVVNGPHETIDALIEEARAALADTVVRRGDTPLPVRTPLPVQLPEPMAAQLREAAAAQQAEAQQQSNEPAARRGAEGSAMQQLRSTTGG